MTTTTKELVQKTSQANKDHQYALKVYTERLEAELQTVDKLLAAAEYDEIEDEPDLDVGGYVHIPGSSRPTGFIPSGDLLSPDSPFYEDASRRQRYLEATVAHPMKQREVEILADAVRMENHRILAYEAHKRGQEAITSLNNQPQCYFEKNQEGIDWERVASKVSSSTTAHVQRTATECAVRWLGDRHPDFNHMPWSADETHKLKELVQKYPQGHDDWAKVAEDLGTKRTPIDCMRRGVFRQMHLWTPETDNELERAVNMYGADNWALVSRLVHEDATTAQCQGRYTRTLDPTIRHGPWSVEEDERLRRAVTAYGSSWVEVAACVGGGRTNDQCRDRWNERVNPTVSKGKWAEEEDKRLLELVGRFGVMRWRDVSDTLGNGRTERMCRTRYEKLRKDKAKAAPVMEMPKPQIQLQFPESGGPKVAIPRIRPREETASAINHPINTASTSTQSNLTSKGSSSSQREVGKGNVVAEFAPGPTSPMDGQQPSGEAGLGAQSQNGTSQSAPPVASTSNQSPVQQESSGANETTSNSRPRPRPRARKKTAQDKSTDEQKKDLGETTTTATAITDQDNSKEPVDVAERPVEDVQTQKPNRAKRKARTTARRDGDIDTAEAVPPPKKRRKAGSKAAAHTEVGGMEGPTHNTEDDIVATASGPAEAETTTTTVPKTKGKRKAPARVRTTKGGQVAGDEPEPETEGVEAPTKKAAPRRRGRAPKAPPVVDPLVGRSEGQQSAELQNWEQGVAAPEPRKGHQAFPEAGPTRKSRSPRKAVSVSQPTRMQPKRGAAAKVVAQEPSSPDTGNDPS